MRIREMKRNKKILIILTGTVLIPAILIAGALYFFALNDLESDYPEVNTEQAEPAQTYVPLSNEPPAGESVPISAFDVVRSIGVGWNLGNALDSLDNRGLGIRESLPEGITANEHYETRWGNPITTREMIDAVVEKGFGAIRIPVTYTDHLDENFQIRHDWLLRVEQVVNYVLDAGVYCIINIHHDTGYGAWPWLRADPDNIEQLSEQFATVWTQIAEHFIDYDYKLFFESFNEILDTESRWNNASSAAYSAVNTLNQVFVDTVRATGGNNDDRFLIVKPYAAGTDRDILDAFVLPQDSAEDRLIVSVQTYTPHNFTQTEERSPWLTTHSDWSLIRDGRPVGAIIGRLSSTFIQHGIPVIIGEFGAMNKGNTGDRINYAGHFIETARNHDIVCFWWDDGGFFENAGSVNNFALFDRFSVQWFFPEIAEALVEAAR